MKQADVFTLITAERLKQDAKWGSLEERRLTVGEWLLIIQGEMEEACQGWRKGTPAPHDALGELLQVAALAVACLEQHAITNEDEEWEEGDHHNSIDGLPAHMTASQDEDEHSEDEDEEWEVGEDAEAEASDNPGYYAQLRTLQEKLSGKGQILMEWAKKNNAESSQPSGLIEYRILAGEVDKLIGEGNHNLLLGVLLGFPIHSQSRPGEQFVRFLLHFMRPFIDKIDENGQVVYEMKGKRRVKAKVPNPKFKEDFPIAIRLAWSQINMEEES